MISVLFKYCPRCKSEKTVFDGQKRYSCQMCDWVFFHNPAAAVGVFLEYESDLVFIRRTKNPGKGMLDLVGGFVDPGETLEQALLREMREEIGTVAIRDLRYLTAFPNQYFYKNILYPTLDMVFVATLLEWPTQCDPAEVQALCRIAPKDVNPEDLAFESMKHALVVYLN